MLRSSAVSLSYKLEGYLLDVIVAVPRVLDCGGYLVGETKVWTTQCFNVGGEGKFRLMLDEGIEEDDNTMV